MSVNNEPAFWSIAKYRKLWNIEVRELQPHSDRNKRRTGRSNRTKCIPPCLLDVSCGIGRLIPDISPLVSNPLLIRIPLAVLHWFDLSLRPLPPSHRSQADAADWSESHTREETPGRRDIEVKSWNGDKFKNIVYICIYISIYEYRFNIIHTWVVCTYLFSHMHILVHDCHVDC